MILILKQKRSARLGALKTLDFALTRSPAACERFVDMLGLKTLFAIFMGRSKVWPRMLYCPLLLHSSTVSSVTHGTWLFVISQEELPAVTHGTRLLCNRFRRATTPSS
jgi:hypothetical protein